MNLLAPPDERDEAGHPIVANVSCQCCVQALEAA